ncbi:HAD family phosphatase [Pseudoalteromonas sp. BDTF-M6]|uniref:HAD family hydrolase n=1 Tax=Pseudoalteromonas sp. BDTF-M6 TaxID=2796132 RepID=UPI001BAF9FB7|nr:HAD family phosphatase [Pseudoalteromonas sp. BDTF-M6]MBS3796199.1 HAD family phosphatase [Pseudoalteromonas sp. BDTF-M6]
MINTLLFDFDGTLVDSEAVHYRCWERVLADYGIRYDQTTFCQRYAGRPTLASAEDMVRQHQLPASAQALAARKNTLFSELAQSSLPPLMAHAQLTLQQAHQAGFTLALVTGSTRDEVEPILQGYQLASLFSCIVCKDDVRNPKPHPEPYLLALEQLAVPARQGIAIEDTSTGSRSAKDAGLAVAAIPNCHTLVQDFSHVDRRFDDLQQFYLWLLQQK